MHIDAQPARPNALDDAAAESIEDALEDPGIAARYPPRASLEAKVTGCRRHLERNLRIAESEAQRSACAAPANALGRAGEAA